MLGTRRRRIKLAVKRCIRKHKDIFRKQEASVAVTSEQPAQVKQAMGTLAKGYDLALRVKARQAASIDPSVFNAHFGSLFARVSDKELLGLTEQTVGPKKLAKTELSGPPKLMEVEQAIKKLRTGTAPGSNGIRPELFKMGGRCLAERLASDFAILWPDEIAVVE